MTDATDTLLTGIYYSGGDKMTETYIVRINVRDNHHREDDSITFEEALREVLELESVEPEA